MHFSCDSCKTPLQIADEKVRGKRLVVRCKRCGTKITISDPALGALPAKAAPAAAQPTPASEERDTDTESTRAMDSDLLEKALQASKRDDAAAAMSLVREGPAARPVAAPAPRPPPSAAPPPVPEPMVAGARDPAVWFAMLGGKQAGPLTRAELGVKTAQASLGPRTYLWKEGMGSWQRAKDVPELAGLFPQLPEVEGEPRATKPPPPPLPPAGRDGLREFSTPDFGGHDLAGGEGKRSPEKKAAAPAPAPAAAPQRAIPDAADAADRAAAEARSSGERVHQDRVAEELFSAGEQPGGQSAVDLARWATSELGKKALAEAPKPAQAAKAGPFAPLADPPVLPAPARLDRLGGGDASRSRLPLFMGLVLAVIALVALALWVFSGDPAAKAEADAGLPMEKQAAAGPAPSFVSDPPDAGPSAGVAGLAAGARAAEPAPAPAARPARKSEKGKPELSAEQAAAMKGLANERGVGSHGPAGDAAPEQSSGQGLTADQVRKKLDASKGALQGCIDEALRRDPNLRVGKIHIATTIAPSGVVTATKIDKRTVDETPLGSCLKRATRRIVFPSFGGDPFDVDIPIVVTAGE